ncbi:MAG: dihydroorotase [Nonlabens sp.]|jgi:dihydroorotase
MDTSQFIGFSDDGLYFTKKENLHAANPESMENLFANSLLLFILKKKS